MSDRTKWDVKTTVDRTAVFGAKVALSSSSNTGLPTVTILERSDLALSASYGAGGILTLYMGGYSQFGSTTNTAIRPNSVRNQSANNGWTRAIAHQVDCAVTASAFAGVYNVQDLQCTPNSGTWTCMVGQYSAATSGSTVNGVLVSGSLAGSNSIDGNAGLRISFIGIFRDDDGRDPSGVR